MKARLTDQEDQQAPKHIWTSRHKAGCSTSQGTGPGHSGGIKHRTDAGEGSGSDGLVPGGTLEQELNIVELNLAYFTIKSVNYTALGFDGLVQFHFACFVLFLCFHFSRNIWPLTPRANMLIWTM